MGNEVIFGQQTKIATQEQTKIATQEIGSLKIQRHINLKHFEWSGWKIQYVQLDITEIPCCEVQVIHIKTVAGDSPQLLES